MIDFLIDAVAGLLAPELSGKQKAKKRARRFADGEEVVFEACVLGTRPHCSPDIVFLAASRNALHMSPTEVTELRRRTLPTDRIEIRRIREWTRSDSRNIAPYWNVAECHDGVANFVIACAPTYMPYVTAALRPKAPGSDPGPRPGPGPRPRVS
ncbi:hypothetical protein AB0467_01170 [Streptomyces sp. NPDC052095]|uniref:hypothetical protein n=1 Tax=unclassified Streptomyces TaxID=2593676 RepID=UPI0034504F07